MKNYFKALVFVFFNCLSVAHATDTQAIYNQAQNSMAKIILKDKVNEPNVSGSAFYVAPNLLLTNYHVVSNYIDKPNFYTIFAKDAKTHNEAQVSLVSFDIANDLALLKTNTLKTQYFKINPKVKLKLGEKVYSMGYPLGISLNLIESTVNEQADDKHYFISTQLSHGMSGGPTFNARGEVIGVNDMVLDNTMNSFLVKSLFIHSLMQKPALNLGTDTTKNMEILSSERLHQMEDLSVGYFKEAQKPIYYIHQLGKYQIVAERKDGQNSCSSHTEVSQMKKVTMYCEDKNYRKIYFSDDMNIPTMAYNYGYYRNLDYSQVNFLKNIPIHELESTGNCTNAGSIKVNAIAYQVSMCVSAYAKLDGLYDVYFHASSLEKDSFFVVNLSLYAVSKATSYNVFNQFLKRISWNK